MLIKSSPALRRNSNNKTKQIFTKLNKFLQISTNFHKFPQIIHKRKCVGGWARMQADKWGLITPDSAIWRSAWPKRDVISSCGGNLKGNTNECKTVKGLLKERQVCWPFSGHETLSAIRWITKAIAPDGHMRGIWSHQRLGAPHSFDELWHSAMNFAPSLTSLFQSSGRSTVFTDSSLIHPSVRELLAQVYCPTTRAPAKTSKEILKKPLNRAKFVFLLSKVHCCPLRVFCLKREREAQVR